MICTRVTSPSFHPEELLLSLSTRTRRGSHVWEFSANARVAEFHVDSARTCGEGYRTLRHTREISTKEIHAMGNCHEEGGKLACKVCVGLYGCNTCARFNLKERIAHTDLYARYSRDSRDFFKQSIKVCRPAKTRNFEGKRRREIRAAISRPIDHGIHEGSFFL